MLILGQMWFRLLCLALLACLPLSDAKFSYKKFNKLFDSDEESVHGSAESREEEVKSFRVSQYNSRFVYFI